VEHVDFLVANLIGRERHRRLHRHKTHDLEQVVLNHVAQGARIVVIGSAMADAHRLGHGDLHIVDILAIPQRLEQGIAEAKGEDVLHGLLAEEVIDPIDLLFRKDSQQDAVEDLGSFQVASEGFFHDDSRPPPIFRQSRLSDPVRNGRDQSRRNGHVEDSRSPLTPGCVEVLESLLQVLVGRVIGEIGMNVMKMRGKRRPRFVHRVRPPGELLHPRTKMIAVAVLVHFLNINADHREVLGHLPVDKERMQRRHQLPPRQIPPAAEDHHDTRLRMIRFIRHHIASPATRYEKRPWRRSAHTCASRNSHARPGSDSRAAMHCDRRRSTPGSP